MKTLAFILNYNTPELTDKLFESLEPYVGDVCDLFVLDNGSDINLRSKHTTIFIEENCYWGGGLNYAFQYMLSHKEYDSLLFLNSDINLDGNNFVETLRSDMFEGGYAIISPSVTDLNAPSEKKSVRHSNAVFRQMANWYTNGCREVKMLDLQCPMFHRKIIEHIKKFDELLKYGWGVGFVCATVCEQLGLKSGVDDRLHIEHIGQASWEDGAMPPSFMSSAMKRYKLFLRRHGMVTLKRKYDKYLRRYIPTEIENR